jgi:hypothetical protein
VPRNFTHCPQTVVNRRAAGANLKLQVVICRLEVDDWWDASSLAALSRCVYLDTADGATRMFLSGHQEGGVAVKGLDAGFLC